MRAALAGGRVLPEETVDKMVGEEKQCLRSNCLFFVCPKSIPLFGILEEEPTAALLFESGGGESEPCRTVPC